MLVIRMILYPDYRDRDYVEKIYWDYSKNYHWNKHFNGANELKHSFDYPGINEWSLSSAKVCILVCVPR